MSQNPDEPPNKKINWNQVINDFNVYLDEISIDYDKKKIDIDSYLNKIIEYEACASS